MVLTTSMPVTDSGEEIVKVSYIYYLVWFQKEKIKALLDNGNKVNAINPDFA